MPELGFMGMGKQQPPEQPRPVAVTFGTPGERALWERLFFIKYLLLTRRIGRGDVGADDG